MSYNSSRMYHITNYTLRFLWNVSDELKLFENWELVITYHSTECILPCFFLLCLFNKITHFFYQHWCTRTIDLMLAKWSWRIWIKSVVIKSQQKKITANLAHISCIPYETSRNDIPPPLVLSLLNAIVRNANLRFVGYLWHFWMYI